jgi:hypothetical protein
MGTLSTTAPPAKRSAGRGLLWAGIGLSLLGVALCVAQYSLGYLIVPWYLPVLTTLGALLLLCAAARRLTVTRVVVFGLLAAFAGLQWLFFLSHSTLPPYEGPARQGEKLPAFRTTLASGRPFTEEDLRDGTNSVLVFFRGRW